MIGGINGILLGKNVSNIIYNMYKSNSHITHGYVELGFFDENQSNLVRILDPIIKYCWTSELAIIAHYFGITLKTLRAFRSEPPSSQMSKRMFEEIKLWLNASME